MKGRMKIKEGKKKRMEGYQKRKAVKEGGGGGGRREKARFQGVLRNEGMRK